MKKVFFSFIAVMFLLLVLKLHQLVFALQF